MQSINFAKGYKTYAINGDENTTVKINVADPNLKNRMIGIMQEIENCKNKYGDEAVTDEVLTELDTFTKAKLDEAFGNGFSQAIFGELSCFAVTEDEGKFVYETFIEAFLPIVTADIEQAKAASRAHIKDLIDSKKLDNIAQQITESAQ